MAERRRKPAPATVDNLASLYAADVANVTATDLAEADTLVQTPSPSR